MEVSVGHFDRALPLAPKGAQARRSTDAIAAARAAGRPGQGRRQGRRAGPRRGACRTTGCTALSARWRCAWTRMAAGDLAGADAALQGLDKFNGFAPLKYFQLGLLYDFAGSRQGRGVLRKTLDVDRPAQLAADRRDGQFLSSVTAAPTRRRRSTSGSSSENAGSELAETVMASKPAGVPQPLIGSAEDGLAEAMFDLASVLNQAETHRSGADLRPLRARPAAAYSRSRSCCSPTC